MNDVSCIRSIEIRACNKKIFACHTLFCENAGIIVLRPSRHSSSTVKKGLGANNGSYFLLKLKSFDRKLSNCVIKTSLIRSGSRAWISIEVKVTLL